MNLSRFRVKEEKKSFSPLLIPVMNLFLILLPFFIQSSLLQQISSVEINIPSISSEKNKPVTQELILDVKRDDVEIVLNGKRHSIITFKKGFENELYTNLQQVKKDIPDKTDIILKVDAFVKYELVISIIDLCKKNDTLFPKVVYYDEVY